MSGRISRMGTFLRLHRLRTDWRAVATVFVVTLLMTVEHYDHLRPALAHHAFERALLYFVVPLVVIVLVFRQSPARYGFRLGDWRAGTVFTVVCCGGLAAVMIFVAKTPTLQAYYAGEAAEGQLPLALRAALDLVGWEFMFRGFLLFALYPVCGPLAIVLQAVPFTIAHFGKPEIETLSCIFGGTVLGYIAWRTGSFLYPFIIHTFLLVFTVLVATGRLG